MHYSTFIYNVAVWKQCENYQYWGLYSSRQPKHHFYCGQTACGNCSIFAVLYLALKKELIVVFSFLANCLRVGQIFEGLLYTKYCLHV